MQYVHSPPSNHTEDPSVGGWIDVDGWMDRNIFLFQCYLDLHNSNIKGALVLIPMEHHS
jgi:hypothetical protein